MLKAWTPRVAEHTFKHADHFRTDVRLAARVAHFKRIEGDWILRVGWVEIDYVINAGFRHKTKVINSEISMRIDNTIALIIENVTKGKKLKHTGFTGTGLTDDVDVPTAIFSEHAELVINAAEVGEAEGGDILVMSGIASDEREFGGRLSGL